MPVGEPPARRARACPHRFRGPRRRPGRHHGRRRLIPSRRDADRRCAARADLYRHGRPCTRFSRPGSRSPRTGAAAAVDALRRELARLPEWSAAPRAVDPRSRTPRRRSPHCRPSPDCRPGAWSRSATSAAPAPASPWPTRPTATGRSARPYATPTSLASSSTGRCCAHVIADLSITGTADVAGTAAIGSLHRLRAQCRGAKERLSRGAVTTLFADVPGYTRRGPADPGRTRRRDPRAPGGVHRGIAGTPVPQPDSSSRPGGGRLRRRRRQYPRRHHGAVRAAPGARDHHRHARTDRRRRRRPASRPPARGRQPDGRRVAGAVDARCVRSPGRKSTMFPRSRWSQPIPMRPPV